MAYQPAVNLTTSTGLAHLKSLFYARKGLDRLQKKFVFSQPCMKDMIPKQEGLTIQWFRYTNPSAVTTPTTEGTVGTGVSFTSKVVGATMSQYTSFATASDLLVDSAIDPVVQNYAELLGYQGGLSVDTMLRNVIDNESSSTNQALIATYLRVNDLAAAAANLEANDVERMDDGDFLAIIHPFARYDLVHDPAAAGWLDIFKYNTNVNGNAVVKSEDRGYVGRVANCKVIVSTNVKTQSSPNRYRAYVFGKNGVGCADLEGRGPSYVNDPKKERFKINVVRPQGASVADPEGVIGGIVSYNFVFSGVVLEGPAGIGGSYRMRTLDPQSTLG